MGILVKTYRLVSIWIAVGLTSSVAFASFDLRSETEYDEDARLAKIEYKTPSALLEPGDSILVSTLKRRGLEAVDPFFAPAVRDYHYAHVLASQDLSRFLAIRYDYVPVDPSLQGRQISLNDGHVLIHTKDHSHRPVALYFLGFARNEINKVLLDVSQSDSHPVRTSALMTLLLPHAYALDAGEASCSVPSEVRLEGYSSIGATVLHDFGLCAVKFVEGAASSVANAIPWNLLTGSTFGQIRSLIGIGRAMILGAHIQLSSEMMTAIQERPDLIAKLICEFAGQLVGDALSAALTAGLSGGASLPVKVLEIVSQGNSFAKKLHEFLATSKLVKREQEIEKNLKESKLLAEAKGARRSVTRSKDTYSEYRCLANTLPRGPNAIPSAAGRTARALN